MVDIARSPNMRQVESLDHRNVYMIKKMMSTLLDEFDKSIENGNKQQALNMKNLVEKIYTKIEPNKFWANRVSKALTEMARKLNQ